VTLFEASDRIGGKIGGETITLDGEPYPMDHGFHAFFRHYYNLDAFLERIAHRAELEPIDDYVILDADGRAWSFGDVETTPGLNLLDLAGKELYRLGEVMLSGAHRHMNAFLAYDREATFASLDRLSFAEWADRAGLPQRLRRVLTIFARAFFAEDDRLSAAEVVKAFHFYYLAHDKGLLYDYPRRAYLDGVVPAIEAYLARLGVVVRTRSPVRVVAPAGGAVEVDGERFDDVVIATPAREARALALRSPQLRAACPEAARRLASLEDGQRYAVLRIWIDRDIRPGLPVFVTTERTKLLDAVASYHRITEADAGWVARRGGAVLELHSYAVPDELPDDEAVRSALLAELEHFFPELAGFSIQHEHLRVRNDFTALHVGMAKNRPVTATDNPCITLAGDWVSLPVPAMLMEGAFTSGLYAANAILRQAGLREAPIESVPLRGLLADMPVSGRKHDAGRGSVEAGQRL
jgi:isorenieratene synthase